MKKHLVIAFFMATMAISCAWAQEVEQLGPNDKVEYTKNSHIVETNPFKYNWFISAGVGGQIYFGDHDKQAGFGDKISPALDVSVGKWFIPTLGMRISYSGLQARGATQNDSYSTGKDLPGKGGHGYWLKKQKFNFMNLHADVMLNLNSLIKGYDETRVWSLIPYVGIGWAYVYDKPHSNSLSGNFGLINSFRVSDAIDINLDIRGTLLTDDFDKEMGHRTGESVLSACVGVAYKFKPRGWTRGRTITRYNTADLEAMQRQLDDANAEIERLKKAIADGNDKQAKVIVKKIASSTLILFPIGSSKLNSESRVNVGMLAEVIKTADPDAVYTITGYADAGTGSKKLNERLSKERAQAVYDCLINEYGVKESQLKMDYKGGVENMFYDDPRLSRAVINYCEY